MRTEDHFEPQSLGVASAPFLNAEGNLTVTYSGGTYCGAVRRNATLIFECSAVEESPEFLGEVSTCQYLFRWRTPAACSLAPSTGAECKVPDPVTGETFDLTRLATQSYTAFGTNNKSYHVSLCRKDNACPDNAAACSETQSYGAASASPVYRDGALTLTYDDGASCVGGGSASTVIEFVYVPKKSPSVGLTHFVSLPPPPPLHPPSRHRLLALCLLAPCRPYRLAACQFLACVPPRRAPFSLWSASARRVFRAHRALAWLRTMAAHCSCDGTPTWRAARPSSR